MSKGVSELKVGKDIFRLIRITNDKYVCEKFNHVFNTYDIVAKGTLNIIVSCYDVPLNLLYKAKKENLFLYQMPQMMRLNNF